MKKIFILFLFICYSSIVTFSQKMDNIITNVDSTHGYYQFNLDNNVRQSEILNSNLYGLSQNYGFKLLNQNTDSLGGYYRYRQTFNNIPIEYSMFILHTNVNGQYTSANGFLEKNINLVSTTPTINPNDAILEAIEEVPASEYYWQDTTYENELKRETNNPDTSYYPVAKLVIIKNNQAYYLCYKIGVSALNPEKGYNVFVDAINGQIVKKVSTFEYDISSCKHDCVQGDAHTLYYGTQYIYTDKYGLPCVYHTRSTCSNTYIHIVDALGITYKDGTNNWTDNHDKPGTTALWCLSRIYDYFYNTFGRKSYNNNYGYINAQVHKNFDNGYWSEQQLKIVLGQHNNKDYTTLDFLGHEFTHGITQFTAELNGENGETESHALNESFSDIFGTMIEFYTKSLFNANGSGDWLIGEEIFAGNYPERSMSNPKSKLQPDTYHGQYWDSQGEPHINDGVQNYWFYLLSEGGSGTNDNGDEYCVQGIGKDKAAAIAYRNLTHYLTSSSQYTDARYYSILAAQDIYGINSNEVAQVINAWYAVGIGLEYSGDIHYNDLTVSSTGVISSNYDMVFNNFNETSSGNYIVTSSTRIVMNPTSTVSSGAYFHAFISPACIGGSKVFDNNNYSNENSLTDDYIEIPDSAFDVKDMFQSNSDNNKEILIYPNPANTNFTISINTSYDIKYDIELKNVFGKTVMIKHNLGNNASIDISILKSGIYFIIVKTKNDEVIKKIIKS